jgi:hypothetical protein
MIGKREVTHRVCITKVNGTLKEFNGTLLIPL